MLQDVRPPERILEELVDAAHRWMAARARERARGPGTDWGKGDNPPAYEVPELQDRAAREARQMRTRFEALVDEFVHGVDRP
ncbi:MAG TPA: hypothetical protein VF188_10300 [Longimicrobiales bacterium]